MSSSFLACATPPFVHVVLPRFYITSQPSTAIAFLSRHTRKISQISEKHVQRRSQTIRTHLHCPKERGKARCFLRILHFPLLNPVSLSTTSKQQRRFYFSISPPLFLRKYSSNQSIVNTLLGATVKHLPSILAHSEETHKRLPKQISTALQKYN